MVTLAEELADCAGEFGPGQVTILKESAELSRGEFSRREMKRSGEIGTHDLRDLAQKHSGFGLASQRFERGAGLYGRRQQNGGLWAEHKPNTRANSSGQNDDN
jgi:hypothetical protein